MNPITRLLRFFSASDLFLLLLVGVAWWPVVGGVGLVADERTFQFYFDGGVWNFLKYHWLEENGVWRLLSLMFIAVLPKYPIFASLLALATHGINVLLLRRVAVHMGVRDRVSLGFSALFAVYPFGFQVMVQTMCYCMMLTLTFFLLCSWILMRNRGVDGRQSGLFIITFFLSLLAQLNYENLIFAFVVLGPVCLWTLPGRTWGDAVRPSFWWAMVRTRFGFFGASVGSVVYLLLFKLMTDGSTTKIDSTLNIGAAISAHLYQYTNYFIFTPWANPQAIRLLGSDWVILDVIIMVLLAVGALRVGRQIVRSPSQDHSLVGRPLLKALFAVAVFLLAATAVYAIAGGYSLDTRKKYALVALYTVALGLLDPGRFISRKLRVALVALLLVVGIATSWLLTSVYTYEVNRQESLLELLRERPDITELHSVVDPGPALWPQQQAALGLGLYEPWVVTLALKTSPSDPERFKWVDDERAPQAVWREGAWRIINRSSRPTSAGTPETPHSP